MLFHSFRAGLKEEPTGQGKVRLANILVAFYWTGKNISGHRSAFYLLMISNSWFGELKTLIISKAEK